MTKRLTRISVLRTSLTIAVAYAVLLVAIGAILAILGAPLVFAIGSLLDADVMAVGVFLAFALGIATLGALLYGLAAFAFTALLTLIYNIAARIAGGVEFTVEDAD